MKSRSDRIEVVVDLAQRTMDQAADNFRDAVEMLEAEQQRLADLEQYYQSYSERSGVGGQVFRPAQLIGARQFIQHLKDAITQQEHTLAKAEHQLEVCRTQWQETHLKHKSLLDYQERLEREDRMALDAAEQKRMDEWANLRASRVTH